MQKTWQGYERERLANISYSVRLVTVATPGFFRLRFSVGSYRCSHGYRVSNVTIEFGLWMTSLLRSERLRRRLFCEWRHNTGFQKHYAVPTVHFLTLRNLKPTKYADYITIKLSQWSSYQVLSPTCFGTKVPYQGVWTDSALNTCWTYAPLLLRHSLMVAPKPVGVSTWYEVCLVIILF
jgi:hypothetical protein